MLQHKTFLLSLSLILAACFSTWLMVKNHHAHINSAVDLQKKPDAFMYHATYFQYDKNGQLHSRLDAIKTTHFPYKNSATFTEPHFLIFSKNRLPWYISAEAGTSDNGVDHIHLFKKVRLYQPPTKTHPATTVKTPTIDVFPEQSTAKTKADIAIIRPGTKMTAQGLRANFKNNIVTLLSHAKGTYKETIANTRTKAEN